VVPCGMPAEVCQAQAAFERADALMAGSLEDIRTKIRADGFADFMVRPEDILESLEAGQSAWMQFRELHCASVFRLMSGGTSRQSDELFCLARVTETRTAQLRELYGMDP